jgi:hypothetical protein
MCFPYQQKCTSLLNTQKTSVTKFTIRKQNHPFTNVGPKFNSASIVHTRTGTSVQTHAQTYTLRIFALNVFHESNYHVN